MAKVKGNSFEAREKKAKKRSSIVKMSELREESIAATTSTPANNINEKATAHIINNTVTENLEVNNGQVAKEVVVEAQKETIVAPVINTKVIEPIKEEVIEKAFVAVEPVVKIEPVIENIEKIEEVKPLVEAVKEAVKEAQDIVEIKALEPKVNKITNEEISSVLINKEDKEPNKENDFFNLNVKNDVFEGKITTVRVYDDILDLLKKYATMKNYQIIEFTNKVITMGIEDISSYDILQISEIKMKNNTSRSIMYNLTDTMEDKLNKYIKMMNKKGYKISRNVILNVLLNETLKKFYI